MTDDAPASGGGISGASLTELIGEAPAPAISPKRFEGWHRPRKQYVRQRQWAHHVENLVARGAVTGGVLKYLTLPGEDLLDVRLLHDRICRADLTMEYVGFNKLPTGNDVSALSIAEYATIRLPHIEISSRVMREDIREAGDPRSASWQAVRGSGPFHAINLDLCAGLASETESFPNYFHALSWILELQQRALHDCILLITTRCHPESISDPALATFQRLLTAALDECPGFAAELRAVIGLGASSSAAEIVAALSPAEAVAAGLALWLQENGRAYGMTAKLVDLMSYRVLPEATSDDMLSMAVWLTPRTVPEPDPTLLAVPAWSEMSRPVLNCESVESVGAGIASRARVDCILESDEELAEVFAQEMAALLETVGYEPDSYLAWARELTLPCIPER